MHDIERNKTNDFKKNQSLEKILTILNDSLSHANAYKVEIRKTYPIIFILGTPRSGTTLLSQWLASLDQFCYPSNLISRFYKAPYIGALVQEMLVNPDYSYKDELTLKSEISYKSDVGKTSGITEPHEFWYYWRQFFHLPDIPLSDKEFLENSHFKGFQEGIHKIQQVYHRPFFLKSLIINPYADLFSKNIEKPLFLFIRRDPVENMKSLISTRKNYFGREDVWFSFKPREYDSFKDKDPYMQVAAQTYFINKELERRLSKIPDANKLELRYEMFCKEPARVFASLAERLAQMDYKVMEKYRGPDTFNASVNRTDKRTDRKLRDAYDFVRSTD